MAEGTDRVATGEALAISAVSTWLGFPLPPTLAMNISKSLGALIGAAIDYPTAWFEAKAQAIRADSAARAEFASHVVGVAADAVGADASMTRRAAHYLGGKMLQEQSARESVARATLEDLKSNPPAEDAIAEIEDDWLHLLARHAETKTNADVQVYFAKVLSGEIRKPGSFSPEGIEVLARLSPQTADLFQAFCSLMTVTALGKPCLIWEPFDNPATNALSPLNISFESICRLGDAGLVRPLSGNPTLWHVRPIDLCKIRQSGETLLFRPNDGSTVDNPSAQITLRRPVGVLVLTAAGDDLMPIVHLKPNLAYKSKFLGWMVQLGLVPVAST